MHFLNNNVSYRLPDLYLWEPCPVTGPIAITNNVHLRFPLYMFLFLLLATYDVTGVCVCVCACVCACVCTCVCVYTHG